MENNLPSKNSLKTIDFSKYSSIKVGPAVDVFMIEAFDYPDGHYLIGSANNLLVGPQHPPLMKLSKNFDYIKIENNQLLIGAATPGGKIVSFCKKNNIANFEFISHLPGTLGGMVQMNAGLKEFEIFNHLISLKFRDKTLLKDAIDYGYRYTNIDDVVFEARFEITTGFDANRIDTFKQMRANQPSNPSAGSFFKNPEGDYAGRLIEAIGFKGKRIGDIAWSEMHANFLVNLGNARFEDALELVMQTQEKVYHEFGICLENEVQVIDTRYFSVSSPLKACLSKDKTL